MEINDRLQSIVTTLRNIHCNNSHRLLTNICNTFGHTIPHIGCNVEQELYSLLSTKHQNGEIEIHQKRYVILGGQNSINQDTDIGEGAIIAGNVIINHAHTPSKIAPGSYLKDCSIIDSRIGNGVIIEGGQYTKMTKSEVGNNTVLFGGARMRDSIIGPNNEIGYGEFVRTTTGELMKALHICYLGDTTVGNNVNIANGFSITNSGPGGIKSKTIIGNNVFTGGFSHIVPGKDGIQVGDGAIIAAGAIVLCDIPANHTYINKYKIYPNK